MKRTFSLALILVLPAALLADDWPQWLGPQRDGVWREKGIVKEFPANMKPMWRTPIGQGYAGPAVFGDRVYLMDRIRSKEPDVKPAKGFRSIKGTERILCLDATSGKQLWKREYDCTYKLSYPSGPRVTPVVTDGRVYVLGAMGGLQCLDAKSGEVVWEKNVVKEYKVKSPPVWGYSASPLVEGDLLYSLVGGEGSAIVAFDKKTGKEVWKALTTEEVGYSPPTFVHAGGVTQLIVWLSESINGLDAKTGKVLWTEQYPVARKPERPAVNIVTVVPHGRLLFVSTVYHGPMMLELDKDKPAAKMIWRGKSNNPSKPDGIHALMATPVLKDGYLYGVCAQGELRCIDAKTNKQQWQTYDFTGGKESDCGTAFIIPKGDQFVIFNDEGELFLAELTPKGHKVVSKAKVIEPVEKARGREVVWSHPAFARKCVFVRNDKEIVCYSLAEEK